MRMGIEVPTQSVAAILKEQHHWTSDQVRRSSADHLQKEVHIYLIYK